MTLPIPTPPPDQAGGILVLGYGNGVRSHSMRVHVLPFAPVPDTGGTSGYAYSTDASLPAHTETDVAHTATALMNWLKTYFANNWTIQVNALYAIENGVPVEQFPPPAVPVVAGASGTADSIADMAAARFISYNFRTVKGRHARIMILGSSVFGYSTPYVVTPTSGGVVGQQSFVAYLSGNDTAICGHDGSKLQAVAHVTTGINKRLRKGYGYA